MKHECDIVRDLMPMVVDGTASEKSNAMVAEHVAECDPCRDMFDEMRQEVPVVHGEPQDGQLVKKLRHRRRLRRLLLVLLGMALCAVLAVVGWRGWLYWFEADVVLVAQENYIVELVHHDIYSTQTIWRFLGGRAQVSNSYFDQETGDLYFWSTTSRLPKPLLSAVSVNSEEQLYYFDDLGYANLISYYDPETGSICFDIMPVNRVIKGAPEDWYPIYAKENRSQHVMYERLNPPDEALTDQWRARMNAWGIYDKWKAMDEGNGRNYIYVWETE